MNGPATNQPIGTLILLLAFVSSSRLCGQEYQFQNFDDLNGLPSSETYQAYQDSKGFIWVGTDNGIVRYDGEEFVSYNSAQGLTDNTVFGFYEDDKDRLWFRTFSGLISYFDLSTNRIVPYAHNDTLQNYLQSSILNDVKVDSLGRLWFSTNMTGPSGYVDEKGLLTLTETSTDTSYVFLRAVNKARGEYTIGIAGRPPTLRGIKIEDRYFPAQINSVFKNSPVANYVVWKGSLYVTVNKDVFRYQNEMLEKVYSSDLPIISLAIDRVDHLWVGFFGGGARRFTTAEMDESTSIPMLESTSVSGILNDSEGGYWFATLDRGVFYFPNLAIRVVHFGSEGDSKISAISCGKNAIYIGRYNGEVSAITSSYDSPKILHKDISPISSLFEDRDGGLWGSSVGRFFHIENNSRHTTTGIISGLKGFFVNGQNEICTYNSSGLYVLDKEQGIRHKYFLIRRPTHMLYSDSVVYVGSMAGFERYTPNMDVIDTDTLFLKTRVASLYSSRHGILVGTIGDGLFLLRKNELVNLTRTAAPEVENVYDITVVDNTIWLATDIGVLVGQSGETLNTDVNWSRIDRSSGLVADKCTDLALLNNEMWVFSDHGISIIPIHNEVFSSRNPTIYIKSSKVNSRRVESISGLLSTDQNNLSIDIGAISFNNRKVSYRHRLGGSQEWIYSPENNISYFSLRPGGYELNVEATLNGIKWVPYSEPFKFKIARPWWATWTFRSLVLAFILVVGVAIYRMRIHSVRRRQNYLELINSHQQKLIDSEIQTQERERKRIAKDLHDGIGTSLSSIKLLLADTVALKEGERQKRTYEINDNLTEVIAEIKRIVYDLHPPALERYGLQVGLKNLVEKINGHGVVSVLYDYYGQREVSPTVSITIYRIIQELINNTIRHAKATEIRIHVNQFEDEINLMYEDNGIGMVGSRFTGLGLHSIESRIRSLQGRMNWESNHKGTFYNFDIPFS